MGQRLYEQTLYVISKDESGYVMVKDACRYALGKHANIVVLTPLELDDLTIDNGSLVAFDTRALDSVSKLQSLIQAGEVFLLPYEPDDLSQVVEQVSRFRETAHAGFVE